MIFINETEKEETISKEKYEIFLKLLSPFAPHITDEIWQNFGHKKTIHHESWPIFDESKIKQEEVNIVVQVNGKVRGTFKASADIKQEEAITKAEELPEVKKWIEGKDKRYIFIPRKILNIVV